MYDTLTTAAIIIGIVALIITVLAIWDMTRRRLAARPANDRLYRWTVADYGGLALYLVGFVFLLVVGMLAVRDRAELPLYHLGYLLVGFVTLAFAGIFAFIRLSVVLRSLQSRASADAGAPDQHHHEPYEADRAE